MRHSGSRSFFSHSVVFSHTDIRCLSLWCAIKSEVATTFCTSTSAAIVTVRPRAYVRFQKTKSSQMCVCVFSDRRCPFSEIPSIRFDLSTLTVVFSYTYISYFPSSHEMTLPSYGSHHINRNHFVFVVCAWLRAWWSCIHTHYFFFLSRLSISNCYCIQCGISHRFTQSTSTS